MQLRGVIEERDWGQVVASARLTYQGEVVQRAEPLSWEAVAPALPPAELSGRCE